MAANHETSEPIRIDLYAMKLHDSVIVSSPYMQVTRVPGGWLYLALNVNDIPNACAVFVPYDNEFQSAVSRIDTGAK